MKRKLTKAIAVVLLSSVIAGTMGNSAFADEISDLKKQQEQGQQDVENMKNQLAYLLRQMSDLETKMYNLNEQMQQTEVELVQAQADQKAQYEDMKLRIKYMYEDQEDSFVETLVSSNSMSEVLNKAEYMQKVYDYDREKLNKMAETAQIIATKRAKLEEDKNNVASLQGEMESKQALLYSTIADQEKKNSGFASMLNAAYEAAAKQAAAQAAAQAATKEIASKAPTGDSSVGSAIVSLAYNYIGTPYRSGGSSPGGFDCSGFTKYLFSQFGYSLSPSSGAQSGGGTRVSGLSEALPGDIICYAGHVALYIGNNQIIHASVPGDYVKLASVNIMPIQSIRRYW